MRRLVLLALLLSTAPALAEDDPLGSPLWPEIRAQVLGEGRVVFDPRVQVTAPANAEDVTQLPVAARVHGLPGVEALVLFADFNPIPRILTLRPLAAEPYVATRIKINMATPVRAAARTSDGVWHVGGTWVDAAGGGCSQPSAASTSPDWQDRLGEIHGRAWPLGGSGASRVRVRLLHPMDTGLAGNIPAFFLERASLSDQDGRPLAELDIAEPVAENPTLSLEIAGQGPLRFIGRDNAGNDFAARITAGGPAP